MINWLRRKTYGIFGKHPLQDEAAWLQEYAKSTIFPKYHTAYGQKYINGSDSLDEWLKLYDRIRDHVRHEDTQVNNRLNWFLLFQGFMVFGYTTAVQMYVNDHLHLYLFAIVIAALYLLVFRLFFVIRKTLRAADIALDNITRLSQYVGLNQPDETGGKDNDESRFSPHFAPLLPQFPPVRHMIRGHGFTYTGIEWVVVLFWTILVVLALLIVVSGDVQSVSSPISVIPITHTPTPSLTPLPTLTPTLPPNPTLLPTHSLTPLPTLTPFPTLTPTPFSLKP
jgi:hypothetical protein